MKRQVISIHGGSTFKTNKEYLAFLRNLDIDLDRYRKERWRNSLPKKLGKGFDVLLPDMPNSANANYDEWRILFGKIAKLLNNNVILMGHSLGAIFLAKYLSENKFPKKILATFLISGPYDDNELDESLGDFVILNNLDKFKKQGGKIFLYQSEDDSVVPYVDLEKYQKALPNAIIRTFKDRGHFNQSEFPELVRDIKQLK